MSEEVKQLALDDVDEDVTVWLEEASDALPLIFPLWPRDFPEHVPVGITLDGELVVALSRRAMLDARIPQRLWFCIRAADLVGKTDAKASWFDLGG